MSSRTHAIATVALVALGTGLWWLLSGRAQQGRSTDTHPTSAEIIEAVRPEPLISSTAGLADGEATTKTDDGPPVVDAVPAEGMAPTPMRGFADQADPDPTLSRYLEAEVRRLIDVTLDQATYDLQSLVCRGHRCQVLTLGRSAAAGPPAPSFIAPILQGLGGSAIRSPTTGAELKPRLELIQTRHDTPSGIEFIIGFSSP